MPDNGASVDRAEYDACIRSATRAQGLYDKARAENERLREALREAREWIDDVGDFMARPMGLLAKIDEVLDAR